MGPQQIKMTTFASLNHYFNGKLSLFLTEVSFDTSEGNQLSYFQNGCFSKFFGDLMSHVISEYADEEMMFSV